MYTTPEIQLESPLPEYVLGCQVGVLFGTLAALPTESVCYIVSRSNVENVLRIAEALGRPFRTTNQCVAGCHLEFHFDAATHGRW